jgi:hypothetical protein
MAKQLNPEFLRVLFRSAGQHREQFKDVWPQIEQLHAQYESEFGTLPLPDPNNPVREAARQRVERDIGSQTVATDPETGAQQIVPAAPPSKLAATFGSSEDIGQSFSEWGKGIGTLLGMRGSDEETSAARNSALRQMLALPPLEVQEGETLKSAATRRYAEVKALAEQGDEEAVRELSVSRANAPQLGIESTDFQKHKGLSGLLEGGKDILQTGRSAAKGMLIDPMKEEWKEAGKSREEGDYLSAGLRYTNVALPAVEALLSLATGGAAGAVGTTSRASTTAARASRLASKPLFSRMAATAEEAAGNVGRTVTRPVTAATKAVGRAMERPASSAVGKALQSGYVQPLAYSAPFISQSVSEAEDPSQVTAGVLASGGLAMAPGAAAKGAVKATRPVRKFLGHEYAGSLAQGAFGNVPDEHLARTMEVRPGEAVGPPRMGVNVLDVGRGVIAGQNLEGIINGLNMRLGELNDIFQSRAAADTTRFAISELRQTVEKAIKGPISQDSALGKAGGVTKGMRRKVQSSLQSVLDDIDKASSTGTDLSTVELNELIRKIDKQIKEINKSAFNKTPNKTTAALEENLKTARTALRKTFDDQVTDPELVNLNHKMSDVQGALEGLKPQYLEGKKSTLLSQSSITPGSADPTKIGKHLAGTTMLGMAKKIAGGSATQLRLANLLRQLAPDDLKWIEPSMLPSGAGATGAAARAAAGGATPPPTASSAAAPVEGTAPPPQAGGIRVPPPKLADAPLAGGKRAGTVEFPDGRIGSFGRTYDDLGVVEVLPVEDAQVGGVTVQRGQKTPKYEDIRYVDINDPTVEVPREVVEARSAATPTRKRAADRRSGGVMQAPKVTPPPKLNPAPEVPKVSKKKGKGKKAAPPPKAAAVAPEAPPAPKAEAPATVTPKKVEAPPKASAKEAKVTPPPRLKAKEAEAPPKLTEKPAAKKPPAEKAADTPATSGDELFQRTVKKYNTEQKAKGRPGTPASLKNGMTLPNGDRVIGAALTMDGLELQVLPKGGMESKILDPQQTRAVLLRLK